RSGVQRPQRGGRSLQAGEDRRPRCARQGRAKRAGGAGGEPLVTLDTVEPRPEGGGGVDGNPPRAEDAVDLTVGGEGGVDAEERGQVHGLAPEAAASVGPGRDAEGAFEGGTPLEEEPDGRHEVRP